MDLVFSIGLMGLNITVTGKKIKPVEKVNLYMQTEMSMMENGKMIRPMVLEFIFMPNLRPSMKVIGKTIQCTVQESRFMQMETSMRVCSNKEKDLARGRIIFQTDRFTKDNGTVVRLKGLEFVSGLMGKLIKVIGWITKKMVWAFLNGPMDVNIAVTTGMIKNTVRAHMFGRMGENILVNGRVINVMEKANM